MFLSYASQDAHAARCICEALRAAGIEVWLDQSELRGGDAWDQKIHRQIHDCGLFVPIISANTESRPEGYFRREWRLAVERTHDMSERVAFLMPVVIDETQDKQADVPEAFLKLQWTRLPGGETPAAFCDRVRALLGGARAPTSAQAGAAVSAAHAAPANRAQRLALVALFALAALAVGLGLWWFRHSSAGPGPVQAVAPLAPSAATDKSIAVLPFVDMSEKHDQEYFSDGLSEELIDQLAHNADLKVIARTSSFAFKGRNEDMRTIASKLGVSSLLEGSVRKAGQEMRITAQLIRAADGIHLWSQTYDRKLTDVFKVQDEIAAAVVTGLKLKLLPAPARSNALPHDIDAYNLYLRGQYLTRRASDTDVEQGIAILKQAIALEPGFAPAHAELANAYLYVGTFGNGANSILDRAREETDTALRIDPALRSARNLRANLAIISWDWAAAKAQLDDLLASGPRDPEALFRRGQLARALGHMDEALDYYRQCLQLDPLWPINHIQLAMLLNAMGRASEARAAVEGAIAINPMVTKAHLLIAMLDLNAGRLDDASAVIENESGEYYKLEGQALVAYAQKRVPNSDHSLQRLIDAYASNAAVQIAQIYAFRGDRTKTFEWLDRAIQQRDAGLVNVKTDPLFVALHGDTRFKAVLRKMNLPEA